MEEFPDPHDRQAATTSTSTKPRRADLGAYANFNAFFTRALKAGARPLDPDPDAVALPGRRPHQPGRRRSSTAASSRPRASTSAPANCSATTHAPRRIHDGSFVDGLSVAARLPPRAHAARGRARRDRARARAHLQRRAVRRRRRSRACSRATSGWSAISTARSGRSRSCWSARCSCPASRRSGAASRFRRTRARSCAATGAGAASGSKRGAEIGRFEMGSTVIVLLPAELGRFSAQLSSRTSRRRWARKSACWTTRPSRLSRLGSSRQNVTQCDEIVTNWTVRSRRSRVDFHVAGYGSTADAGSSQGELTCSSSPV